jgi:mannose-6-phosphate isomerase-like protein (cupin superfamily)/uncharacterized protein YndB with AHSA1/START domain
MVRTLEMPELGLQIELLRTDDPEMLEFDVVGRARGFITQEHVHLQQVERHEVVSGMLRLAMGGAEHVLHPGEAMEVPAGTPHRQLPAGDEPGRVRVTLTPALDTLAFLERLATMPYNRFGYPTLVAAAELVRDFGDEGHASHPPIGVQRALSRAVLGGTRAGRHLWREYVFVDEWDVAAPIEAVHAALADARTYPEWWRPVYIEAEADGPPAVGRVSRQLFKGRLPYRLRTRSEIVRLEPPRLIEGHVDGDLRGVGIWTLTPTAGGTHVRFDWRVHADRRLLQVLTPLLRPLLRWNHNWAIARAIEGLEPYALRTAAVMPAGEASPRSGSGTAASTGRTR